MTRRSWPFLLLAAGYVVVVGILTLGPTPWRTGPVQTDYDVLSFATWLDPATWLRPGDIGSDPIRWARTTGVGEFLGNVLLFLPLGMLLRLALPRGGWVGATLVAASLSFAIEVLQMGTPRVSDPRDLVANTAGALLGAVIVAAIASIRRRATRRAAERRAAEPPTSRDPVPQDLTRAVG